MIKQLKAAGSSERARNLSRFFKTAPGEYGAGDLFLGLTVPQIRAIVKDHANLPLGEIKILLASKYHEVRLAGAMFLVEQARGADRQTKKQLAEFYLKNLKRINNWDLVDLSAPTVVGEYLLIASAERKILRKLSKEKNMWARRVAMLATFPFIRGARFNETLVLAERYLRDREDLMHKATGWMLREVGKRDDAALKKFLANHARIMPRTMLRYAIERLTPAERRYFMK